MAMDRYPRATEWLSSFSAFSSNQNVAWNRWPANREGSQC